jgi:hypothetical protein
MEVLVGVNLLDFGIEMARAREERKEEELINKLAAKVAAKLAPKPSVREQPRPEVRFDRDESGDDLVTVWWSHAKHEAITTRISAQELKLAKLFREEDKLVERVMAPLRKRDAERQFERLAACWAKRRLKPSHF